MIRKLNDSLYVTKKVTSNEGKACTGQNTVILPNFMVGKFCGNAKPAERPKLCGN